MPRVARADRPSRRDPPNLNGYLYDADGHDREVDVDAKLIGGLNGRSLLWIDLTERSEAIFGVLAELLKLDPASVAQLLDTRPTLRIDNYGDYLQFGLLVSPHLPEAERTPVDGDDEERSVANARLDMLIGENWVVTAHEGDLAFLRGFRGQDKAETRIGVLSAPILASSLLDWHLETFFAAVARIELAVDALDHRLLGEPTSSSVLGRIMAIRRRTSRLRRALMAQRSVFYGLSRPDLTPIAEGDAAQHFERLAARFERAIDEVEHTRDLVVGSFELFTSRSAQQTNELVKGLTFFTVIVGVTAAVAGLFGMNFDPPFFQTGSAGFFAVTLGLVAAAALAWIVARRRKWV